MVPKCAVILALCAYAIATNVKKCSDKPFEGLSELIDLSNCVKPPCKLKKGTDQPISIAFTPDKDITNVKNSVSANVYGVDVPFVGVDGVSICDKLYNKSGDKVGCPVKAGETFIYKDSFPILAFYPTLSTTVVWKVIGDDDTIVSCFKTRANIIE